MGNAVLGQVALADSEDVIARQQQVQECFNGRRIEVGKFLGRLNEAVVAGKVFEEEARHDSETNANIRRLTVSLLIKSASPHLHQLRYSYLCRKQNSRPNGRLSKRLTGLRLQRTSCSNHRFRSDAQLLHRDVARGAETETVDADNLAVEADILAPKPGYTGLDR